MMVPPCDLEQGGTDAARRMANKAQIFHLRNGNFHYANVNHADLLV